MSVETVAWTGVVEVFAPGHVEGWVEVERTAPPVRVSLYLNDLEVASCIAELPSGHNTEHSIRGFRFILKDIWKYCQRRDRLTVRVAGRPLPITKKGMFKRTPKGASTAAELQRLLRAGYAFNRSGELIHDLDTATRAGEASAAAIGRIPAISEPRLLLSRKKFDRLTADALRLAGSSATDANLRRTLITLAEAAGSFNGSLSDNHDPGFLSALDDARDELIQLAGTAGDDSTDYEAWMTAHDVLMLGMYILDAQSCRQVAESILERYAHAFLLNPRNWRNITALEYMTFASWAACRSDDTMLLRALEMYARLAPQVANEVRPVWRGLLLCKGDVALYREMSEPMTRSTSDQAYGRYLEGKSIAVVGPVNVGLPSGQEIESHDVVIRFNHHDASTYDETCAGLRTDISYYTNPGFKSLVVNRGAKLKGLKFAIPQNASTAARPEQLAALEPIVKSQYRRSNAVIFKSHGNAAQRLLFDLYRFECGPVKFFNMNLWLTEYCKVYRERPVSYPWVFIHHDPIANFAFTRRAVSKAIVRADEKLGQVLATAPLDYVRKLNASYGRATTNSVRSDASPQFKPDPARRTSVDTVQD